MTKQPKPPTSIKGQCPNKTLAQNPTTSLPRDLGKIHSHLPSLNFFISERGSNGPYYTVWL